ncbi:MAG: thioredoxin family protein [Terrimonas sp.]|nr:thioredoxin family protein [Terrimonas sp.]OJY91203.1 MAG: glutaredoxin [Sphingobacteriales bacterium 40-81]
MKQKIEVFTAGCPVCEPIVQMVKEMACDSCEVTVYNVVEECDSKVCVDKMNEYNVTSLPAVAVNGNLLSCCKDRVVSKDELIAAGVGKAN